MLLPVALLLASPDLAPLDWLVGHCWRGTLATGDTDTHCFAREDEGIRDRHEVVRQGRMVYWGETRFDWDAATRTIRYSYVNANGPVESGTVTPRADGLDFGTVRWVRLGERAYETVAGDARVRFIRAD